MPRLKRHFPMPLLVDVFYVFRMAYLRRTPGMCMQERNSYGFWAMVNSEWMLANDKSALSAAEPGEWVKAGVLSA